MGLVRIYVEAGAAALHSPTWSFEVPPPLPGLRLRATSRPAVRPRGGGDGAPRPSTEPPSAARGRPRRTPHSRPGASDRSSGAEAGEDGGGCSGECARPPRRRLGKRKPVVRSPARRRRRAGRPGSGRIAIRGIEEGGGVGPLGAGVPGTAVLVRTRAGGARGGGGPGARRGPARRTQWPWGGWARGRRPLPGASGPGRGARRPCGQSFSRGRELKRLQNKAAAAHGAGRGPGGGAPTRNLRAGGRAAWAGGPETLCAPELAPGRGGRGAQAPPARSAWAFVCHRVGSSLWCGVAPHWPRRCPPPPPGPGSPRRRRGAGTGRWLASAAREGWAGSVGAAAPPPCSSCGAGRAARAEGGGHGGHFAPPAADCSRRRPWAACGEPGGRTPFPSEPRSGPARGTKDGRRVRSLAPPGPRRRSSRSRPGAGGRGDSARPALTCRPLAAARGPAGPLVRHVLLPARAP